MKKKETKKPMKKKDTVKKPKKKPVKKITKRTKAMQTSELLVCHARIQNQTWDNARCYREGYPNCNRNSSYSLAHEFFKKPHIKKYIDDFKKRMIEKVEVDEQYIIKGLMKIVEFNPQCFEDKDGNPVALKDLDPEDAKILDSIKFEYIKLKTSKHKEKIVPVISNYKTPSQTAAYELLGKYLKMWTDKKELEFTDDLPNRIFNINFVEGKEKDDKK